MDDTELSDVVARVLLDHEPRPMACKCGTPIGDSIDRRWHEANRVARAVRDAITESDTPSSTVDSTPC